MIKNRTCLCCSTRYNYCPSCSTADKLKPTWYSNFCSEECMTLWKTATRYNMNTISKQEAKTIVESLELENTPKYAESVQRTLEKILKEDIIVATYIEEEQPVVEEKLVAHEEELIIEPSTLPVEEVITTSYKKTRRNKKTHEVVTTEENE